MSRAYCPNRFFNSSWLGLWPKAHNRSCLCSTFEQQEKNTTTVWKWPMHYTYARAFSNLRISLRSSNSPDKIFSSWEPLCSILPSFIQFIQSLFDQRDQAILCIRLVAQQNINLNTFFQGFWRGSWSECSNHSPWKFRFINQSQLNTNRTHRY